MDQAALSLLTPWANFATEQRRWIELRLEGYTAYTSKYEYDHTLYRR